MVVYADDPLIEALLLGLAGYGAYRLIRLFKKTINPKVGMMKMVKK